MKSLSLILKIDLRYALKNRVTRRQDINKITSWNQIEEPVKYIRVKSPLWSSRSSANLTLQPFLFMSNFDWGEIASLMAHYLRLAYLSAL